MDALFKTLHERMLKPLFSFHSSWRGYKLIDMLQLHAPRLSSLPPARPSRLLQLAAPLLSAALLAVGPAMVQAGDKDHEMARQALQQGQVLPLRTVIDQVEKQYQGQVLKVEFEHEDGRYLYEIRLLQADGRMVKMEVDARDGRLLKMKRKD